MFSHSAEACTLNCHDLKTQAENTLESPPTGNMGEGRIQHTRGNRLKNICTLSQKQNCKKKKKSVKRVHKMCCNCIKYIIQQLNELPHPRAIKMKHWEGLKAGNIFLKLCTTAKLSH